MLVPPISRVTDEMFRKLETTCPVFAGICRKGGTASLIAGLVASIVLELPACSAYELFEIAVNW